MVSERAPKTSEYRSYIAAKRRCTNPKDIGFKYYGGRGIEMRFKTFEEFYAEIGPKPSPEYTVDRIDTNGHYEPGNVRWITQLQQNSNRRSTKGPNASVYRGVARHGTSWSAYIFHKGKQTRLGSFRDEADAARAYDKAAIETWGSEAFLNFPNKDSHANR